jgi:hypothetical protein
VSATENQPQTPSRPQPHAVVAGVSMRDLLASCAAATAVSTPPRLPDPETVTAQAPGEHRKAA